MKQLTIIFVPVYCGPTPSIPNAVCTAVDGVSGDVVTYSCLPGYSLSNSGTGQRTCDSSGTWVTGNTDPVCEESKKENKTECEKEKKGGEENKKDETSKEIETVNTHPITQNAKHRDEESKKYEAKLKQKQTQKEIPQGDRQTDRDSNRDKQTDRKRVQN